MKAGKLAYGTDMCVEKIKNKKAKLIIVSEDASDNTKEKFSYLCKDNNIPLYLYGAKDDLSRSVGKNNKTVFAILDTNFAKSIKQMVEDLKGAIC